MQAQLPKQGVQTITPSQSIACVQTLLKAGLGCIAFVRDLLPQDNFSTSYLTTSSSKSRPSSRLEPSTSSQNSQGNSSGFKVMTINRGWSLEADKLLDFVEKGMFEALEKAYLKSFIFAIYLDEDDPNNLAETYTFNFQYVRMPGSDAVIPVISLGNDLTKLTLNDSRSGDPVTRAISDARLPTLGDVKKSLKALVKQLLSAINQMDRLPNRKFVTFKLFYYPHTPSDYEPPFFTAGDPDRDRFFFSTHDATEMPEKWSIGKLDTGYHNIDLHIASVSSIIPSSDQDSLPFNGLSDKPKSYANTASSRRAEVEKQKQDAQERRVVWDAERISRMDSADLDAEGDPDLDHPQPLSGVDALLGPWIPEGLRQEDGKVAPISKHDRHDEHTMDVDCTTALEIVYGGHAENASQALGGNGHQEASYEQTQRIGQLVDESLNPRSGTRSTISTLPPSDIPSQITERSSKPAEIQDDIPNLETLRDMEDDPMRSYNEPRTRIEEYNPTTPKKKEVSAVISDAGSAGEVSCACGVQDDLEVVLCDQCDSWHHIWCMGFHSSQDQRIPDRFLCFKCTVETDKNWDVICVQSWYPTMMSSYANLALFRRAIKLCEVHNPESQQVFTKLLGCESLIAGRLFKRLEQEEFIALQSNMENVDNSKKGKANKKKKARKNLQRARYVFVRTSCRSSLYNDYFDPDRTVEMRMIGLADVIPLQNRPEVLVPASPAASIPVASDESQTQLKSPNAPPTRPKRKSTRHSHTDGSMNRDKKKVKVSVSAAIDLYE